MFKKKKNQSRYGFKSRKTQDHSVLSEVTNLIDIEAQPNLPSSLLFYQDLSNLQSSFNVCFIKAKKQMQKKLTSTWGYKPQIDQEINQALEECYKHVKIFEKTLKSLDTDDTTSIFGKLVNSIRTNFSIKLKEMILELKNQEQSYFQKLQGMNQEKNGSAFDFINQQDENQFEMDKVIYDDNGKRIMIKEISEDNRQDLQNMLSKIESLTNILSQMNDMTIQQGAIVDRIDYHIELALERTQNANKQLFIAKEDMEKGCAAKIVRFLIIANCSLLFLNFLRNYLGQLNFDVQNKLQMKANFLTKRILNSYSVHQKKISYLVGNTQLQQRSEDVELRGLHLHGKSKDLPSLIFFPDLFDQVENWLNFFTHSKSNFLEQRDVFILYPRNFGSSDQSNEKFHPVQHLDQLGKDVERFMYTHRISTATLGGHGFGAKYALMASCYKSENVSGFFGIDYSPLNYNYHSFAHELKAALNYLVTINPEKLGRKQFISLIEQHIPNKKLALLFVNQLKFTKDKGLHFNFNLKFIQENIQQVLNWETSYGLYPGRSFFIIPEYTNRVHLGTNTLPMYNVCPKLRGLNKDIHLLQCEEDNLEKNHWIYENAELQEKAVKKLEYFLNFYDGINVQYMNKHDMMNNLELVKQSGEKDGQNESTKVASHFHHNWKFQE